MKKIVLLILIACIGCKKYRKTCKAYADQDCQTSTITVWNKLSDTVFYEWGDESLSAYRVILPGQSDTREFGKVHMAYDKKCEVTGSRSRFTALIKTRDQGEWYIEGDHCRKQVSFEYDPGNPSNTPLYNITDYSK